MSVEFPLYLPGGRRGFLAVPPPLNIADFALLKDQVENALSVINEVFVSETITHGALVQANEPRGADSENRDCAITKAVGEVGQDEGPRGGVAAVEQAGTDS